MCDFITNIIISSLTGVGASIFVWWLTFKYWVPRIRFSTKISKLRTEENDSGFKYRFKYENYGKRNAIDSEVIVRLRIKGLRRNLLNNWEVVYLPTSTLEYKRVAIIRPVSKSKLRFILEIKPYECEFFQNSIFPDNIIENAQNKTLSLDDVLGLGTDSEFQIMMMSTDEFSGARKYFESNVYRRKQIIYGHFEKNSLEVIEEDMPV